MGEGNLSAIQFQAALSSLVKANRQPELALELILQSTQNLTSDPARSAV